MSKAAREAAYRTFRDAVAAAQRALEAELEAIAGKEPRDGPGYSEEFEKLWVFFRNTTRKDGGSKVEAWRVWERIRPTVDPAEVCRGVLWRMRSDRQWKDGFIPHLRRYLHGRGWEGTSSPSAVPKPKTDSLPDARAEERRVEASWKEAWQRSFPGLEWPGLQTAMAKLMASHQEPRSQNASSPPPSTLAAMVAGLAESCSFEPNPAAGAGSAGTGLNKGDNHESE